jgi:hypothetical protein
MPKPPILIGREMTAASNKWSVWRGRPLIRIIASRRMVSSILNSVEDLFYREGERDFLLSSKDSLSFWTCAVMRA